MRVSSNGRVHRSKEEWHKIVTRFAKSGLNRRDFCHREKLKKASFDRWYKRAAAKEQNDFVELAPKGKDSSSWIVEVELSDGTIVRVGS